MAQSMAPKALKPGHHIFIYNNIRTNQVVYSLTRTLNNNDSLKQLPFLGKKTVPAALRKDLWTPLALIEFPHPSQGLLAYRKLREYRRLHETAYDLSLITQTKGQHRGQLMSIKSRGRTLMNQKANSVADIAAVLKQQEIPPDWEKEERKEMMLRKDGRPLAKRGPGSKKFREPNVTGSVEGVRIRWANILDAEFAETWPEGVLHDGLGRSRYTAAFLPQMPVEGLLKEGAEAGEEVGMEEPPMRKTKAAGPVVL